MRGPAARLFAPARLGPIAVRNRFIKCATYETRSHRGHVTDALIDWHREFATGGVGMTTLAYCAVSPAGRTFADQIWLREECLPGLRRFCAACRHWLVGPGKRPTPPVRSSANPVARRDDYPP